MGSVFEGIVESQSIPACIKVRRGRLSFRVNSLYAHDETLVPILESPEDVLRSTNDVLKDDHRSRIVKVDGLIVKRFNCRRRAHSVRDIFRRSDAARTWDRAWRLIAAGVPTAEPIAYADRRVLGLPVCSYLVMRAIPKAMPLSNYFAKFGLPPAEVMGDLARQVARFHDAGFHWNRDMNDNNILVNDRNEIYFVDIDGVRCATKVAFSRVWRDLQTLVRALARCPELSLRDTALFVETYSRARVAIIKRDS